MYIPIVSIKTHILGKEINTKQIKKLHCHDIAEILLMLALNINQSIIYLQQKTVINLIDNDVLLIIHKTNHILSTKVENQKMYFKISKFYLHLL